MFGSDHGLELPDGSELRREKTEVSSHRGTLCWFPVRVQTGGREWTDAGTRENFKDGRGRKTLCGDTQCLFWAFCWCQDLRVLAASPYLFELNY